MEVRIILNWGWTKLRFWYYSWMEGREVVYRVDRVMERLLDGDKGGYRFIGEYDKA